MSRFISMTTRRAIEDASLIYCTVLYLKGDIYGRLTFLIDGELLSFVANRR